MPPPAQKPAGGFAKKVGPFPLIVWVLLGAGLVVTVVLLKRAGNKSQGTTLDPHAPGGNYTFGPSYYMPTQPPIVIVPPPNPNPLRHPSLTSGKRPRPVSPPMCPPGMEPVGGICVPIQHIRGPLPPSPVEKKIPTTD